MTTKTQFSQLFLTFLITMSVAGMMLMAQSVKDLSQEQKVLQNDLLRVESFIKQRSVINLSETVEEHSSAKVPSTYGDTANC
jgi:hypothetical protein